MLVAGGLLVGWWHYTGLKANLSLARAELASAKAAVDAAIAVAENNAAQLTRAQAQHRAALAAMEDAYEELAAATDAARKAEREVLAASDDHDGPVAPLLEQLRQKRFGGQP